MAPAPARQAPHVCGTDIQLPGCLLWCPRGPRGPGLLVWGFPPREQTRHSQALGGEDGATEPFEGSCGAGGSGGSAAGEAGQDLKGSVQSRQSSEEGPERAHTRSMDGVGAGSSEVAGCTVVCSTGAGGAMGVSALHVGGGLGVGERFVGGGPQRRPRGDASSGLGPEVTCARGAGALDASRSSCG